MKLIELELKADGRYIVFSAFFACEMGDPARRSLLRGRRQPAPCHRAHGPRRTEAAPPVSVCPERKTDR
jgi:hypothetical protein